MQFNNYGFILCFLPVLIQVYYLASRFRAVYGKIVLIAAGIIFYSLGRADMLIYLGISMVINYLFAYLIKKKRLRSRLMVALPVAVNILLLLYFKYTGFALESIGHILGKEFSPIDIVLPLGISFYTFQQIAYVVSIYRGEPDNVDLIDYLCYILYFPKLIMGPLMEPSDFMAQINDPLRKKFKAENLASGIKLFSYGLFKKVLIADTFSRAVLWVYDNLEAATAMDCVLLILFYTFEIYFDFSGYSDMAIGVSEMLGIDLPMNFDSPYKAVSVRDFWKRWHMSLTKFLTKYLYIPMGGSRKGTFFTYLNTMIVFLVSGLWHGANWTFVLWGALHGLFSIFDRVFEKIEKKVPAVIRWAATFVVVSILWLLFSAESIAQWIQVLVKTAGLRSLQVSAGLKACFDIAECEALFDLLHISPNNMLLFIVATFALCLIPKNACRTKDRLSPASMVLSMLLFVLGVLRLGSESTFVYFGF